MKTDKNSLILGLVIGIVIGGVAMGILDAKRPKPLFSSASEGGCGQALIDEANITSAEITRLRVQQGKNTYNNDAIATLMDYAMGLVTQWLDACTTPEAQ